MTEERCLSNELQPVPGVSFNGGTTAPCHDAEILSDQASGVAAAAAASAGPTRHPLALMQLAAVTEDPSQTVQSLRKQVEHLKRELAQAQAEIAKLTLAAAQSAQQTPVRKHGRNSGVYERLGRLRSQDWSRPMGHRTSSRATLEARSFSSASNSSSGPRDGLVRRDSFDVEPAASGPARNQRQSVSLIECVLEALSEHRMSSMANKMIQNPHDRNGGMRSCTKQSCHWVSASSNAINQPEMICERDASI